MKKIWKTSISFFENNFLCSNFFSLCDYLYDDAEKFAIVFNNDDVSDKKRIMDVKYESLDMKRIWRSRQRNLVTFFVGVSIKKWKYRHGWINEMKHMMLVN